MVRPAELDAERKYTELLSTRHRVPAGTPFVPILPNYANDAESTVWELQSVAIVGGLAVCNWRRLTSVPLVASPPVDSLAPSTGTPVALQAGVPLSESAPAHVSSERHDLELLAGKLPAHRLVSRGPSTAPAAPVPVELPYWAEQRRARSAPRPPLEPIAAEVIVRMTTPEPAAPAISETAACPT